MEDAEKKQYGASRSLRSGALREALKSFSSVASAPSPCFSVLKNLLA